MPYFGPIDPKLGRSIALGVEKILAPKRTQNSGNMHARDPPNQLQHLHNKLPTARISQLRITSGVPLTRTTCRSEGRSSRGISSPGGGADQDQVFPCCCRRVVSSSDPKNQKICKFLHAPRTEDQKSKKSAKIDKNHKCPE